MYVAMNRFKVIHGQEDAFETVWRNRRTRLDEMAGFRAFHLLRGPARDGHTLYASHTVWADEAAFRAWTTSEQFRAAHRDAGVNNALYVGHPEFEGFAAVEGV